MNLFILFFLLAASAGAQQIRQVYGFPASSLTIGASAMSLNTAASKLAFSFVPTSSRTLTGVSVVTQSVTSTPPLAATDTVCEIYADVNGEPGTTPLASATSVSAPTGAQQWVNFVFNTPLTAFTQYWIVLRNAHNTPTTNYPAFRYSSAAAHPFITNGAPVKTSTTAGPPVVWATGGANSFGLFKLTWATGNPTGYPFEQFTAHSTADVNTRIYGTRQSGAVFTLPAGASLRVRGCGFTATKSTVSMSGSVSCVIYNDNGTTATQIGETTAIPPAAIETASGRWLGFWFTSVLTLTGGNTYRMALRDSTGNTDSSTSYYGWFGATVEASSHSLMPMNGMRGAWCAGTCTTSANWTLSTSTPIAALILDSDGEFGSSGSSGSSFVFVR